MGLLFINKRILPATALLVGHYLGGQEGSQVKFAHGTLVVAIATPEVIVVVSDSRRTNPQAGTYADNSKKLFVESEKRIIGIAGLADVSLSDFPSLTAQIAPLIDETVSQIPGAEEQYWSEPPIPDNWPPDKRQYWNDEPMWWRSIRGPMQTIANIAATLTSINPQDLYLEAIFAGYRSDGHAKLEKLAMIPTLQMSSVGRPWIGIASNRQRQTTAGELIWMTAGDTGFANAVLGGTITDAERAKLKSYLGIVRYLKALHEKQLRSLTEDDLVNLAKDLIRATAAISPVVGSDPIQVAKVHPGRKVELSQPAFPSAGYFLGSSGTWYMGQVLSDDYSFNTVRPGAVFTTSEIRNNKTAVRIGDNYFFGDSFVNATAYYDGGTVNFARNEVKDSTLLVLKGVDIKPLTPVIAAFKNVRYIVDVPAPK